MPCLLNFIKIFRYCGDDIIFHLVFPQNFLRWTSSPQIAHFKCLKTLGTPCRKLGYILPSNNFNCLIFWMLSHWDEKCLHKFRPTKRTFDLSSEARLATFKSTPWYHNGMKIILEFYFYFYNTLPRFINE